MMTVCPLPGGCRQQVVEECPDQRRQLPARHDIPRPDLLDNGRQRRPAAPARAGAPGAGWCRHPLETVQAFERRYGRLEIARRLVQFAGEPEADRIERIEIDGALCAG